MSRSLASLITLMIRYLLNLVKHSCAKIDKCNISSIMRMPLGRHADTGRVAWMIDPESAMNLPLDQQVETCIRAWRYQSGGCEWLESEIEHLAIEMAACYRDSSEDVGVGVPDDKLEMLLFDELSALPEHLELVKRFRAACESLGSFPNKQVIYRVTVCEPELEEDSFTPIIVAGASNGDAATAEETDADQSTAHPPLAKQLRRRVGKGWAQSVIEKGFDAGEFHQCSRSDGQNGIGAAIIVCDGDREAAKELLLRMSAAVPVDDEDMKARARWIEWAVPRNNINVYADTEELPQHREIAGVVMPQEMQIALKFVARLMAEKGKRRINDKGARVLTHLIELAQLNMRHSTSNKIAISARTFEAEIAARWPGDKTTQMDVHRKLALITAGDECIVEVLRQTSAARSAYDAQKYGWGADYQALTLEIEQASRCAEDLYLRNMLAIAV